MSLTRETEPPSNGRLGQLVPNVSVVVIGRNEGDRLLRCLESVRAANWSGVRFELIYVDSQSTDTSVVRAQGKGARVFLLDDPSPCAAKARNLGWQEARGEFVLFLDGDTELHPEFVGRAIGVLHDPRVCGVWGHRRELRPEQSLYTRVLDLDWVYPTGRTLYFGGDVLVRRCALQEAGGFDPGLKAGEEPELCARLRAAGWAIEHIDAPMTRHDLAIRSLRSYWRRAYRSGIAYAEVAERMRRRGDVLWQHEAVRDLRHGTLFIASPLLLVLALAVSPWLATALLALAGVFVLRSARRCAWKATGQPLLQLQYAVHSHFQKIPALFGQLAWRRAQRRDRAIELVEYKDLQPTCSGAVEPFAEGQGGASRTQGGDGGAGAKLSASPATRRRLKRALVGALVPVAGLWRRIVIDGWLRLWSAARLREGVGREVDASNVLLGPVELHGTRNVRIGRDALVYPGVTLETQGQGVIEIGDGVVLSRGVHIVAFERVTLADGVMIGEYSSLRDANHRRSETSVRHSGHEAAPIDIGRNAWIGRGVTVLMGATLGENCVVAANAVVTRAVAAGSVVAGIPAAPIDRQRRAPESGVRPLFRGRA